MLFGSAGQAILGGSDVAIVGAGGVGMLLMQTLSRLGVGHLLVVDPERVDPTNLPRLPETTWLEAMDYFDRSGVPEPIRREVRADGLLIVARSCTR